MTNTSPSKKALNAASDGDTIVLAASIEVYADLTVSTSGTVTIDLTGNNLTIDSGVSLTVESETTIVIVDSEDSGLVTNDGTIAVGGTLDIRDLDYTTDLEGSGLLGQQSGQISIASTGTFIVPDVWETYWGSAWDPIWSTAAHIFSSVESGATVFSFGKGWVCVTDFTGTDGYSSDTTYWEESGTYLVEYFKTSRGGTEIDVETSTTWTYPTGDDNTIFAGWYDSEGTVYSGTSGVAYASFVQLSSDEDSVGIINFLGGSLRMDDATTYTSANLRFGYDIIIPSDYASYSWSWSWSIDGYAGTYTVSGSASTTTDGDYTDNGVGTELFRSNLVITGIPSAYYTTNLLAALTVTYTTGDGTTVTATEASAQSRSVQEVAQSVVDDASATDAAKTYATNILSAISSS